MTKLRSRESGFTLIELMVTLAIASFAIAVMYSMFVGTSRATRSEQDNVSMQDNGRIAMDFLLRDIRNTGFLVPSIQSVRIENDCGNANNKVDYTPATGVWKIGSTASGDSIAAGNYPAFKAAPSGSRGKCPNGSDRITVVTKPDIISANTCNVFGCLNNNSGLGTVLRIPCEGATPGGVTGDCDASLAKAMPNSGFTCAGNVPPGTIYYMQTCQSDDPTKCAVLPVNSYTCNEASGCPISGSGGGKLACIKFDLTSFSGSAWDFSGGTKDGLDTNGVTFRTYQIMDYDGDGSTELVYSDFTEAAILQPLPTDVLPPSWVVVANNIDDLQFAWRPSSTPTFATTSLFDFPGCKTSTSNPATSLGNCLKEVYLGGAVVGGATLGPTALVQLRVSLISRSERRGLGNSSSDQRSKFTRGALEDNAPASQPYIPASAVSYGCPATVDYDTCSGNGNAEGFKRRVLSEVVGLRNTVGFAF